MSIDFSTIKGITIPEGVVTQITDSLGRVIWAAVTNKPAILKAVKVTSDTYVGETSYVDESFILLDIYPKTNGTVKVTYGGLTKTIKDTSGAAEPNAIQVFFGTFNGVSDSAATPASGDLIIEGNFYGFGVGTYVKDDKDTVEYCACISAINDFGSTTDIPQSAFRKNKDLIIQEIPEGVETIGDYSFAMLATSTQVTGGSQYKLNWDTAMEGGSLVLPSTITSIGSYAFASTSGVKTSSDGSADTYPCYLAKVKILATEPPTLGTAPFGTGGGFANNVTYRVKAFEVPKGRGDAYKAAPGWSDYATRITEAS